MPSITGPHVTRLLDAALGLHLEGRLALAEVAYKCVLAADPRHIDALHLLGVILIQRGEFSEAIYYIDKAIAGNPDEAVFFLNRGSALQELKKLNEAIASFDGAIALNPNYADAHYNKGNALRLDGRLTEALASYDRAIELGAESADVYFNRGKTLQSLNRLEGALKSFDLASSVKQDYSDAWVERGNVLAAMNRLEEALAAYDGAIRVRENAEAFNNRALTLQALNKNEEAVASFDRAIQLDPDEASAHLNKSLCLLLQGRCLEGWALYERRWMTKKFVSTRRLFSRRLWLGDEDVSGKTLLLHAEQGLGDTIQFCRYVKVVKALGARVVLEVPEALTELMKSLDWVDEIVPRGRALPPFDLHCPLMSLPHALATEINSIPSAVPYLSVSADRKHRWSQFIGRDGYKIAISWQGNPTAEVDVGRSVPLKFFESISKINPVRLISLQKNHGSEQLKNLPDGMRVETLPDTFDGGHEAFLDSAAVIENVDLVISTDSALTHLAGALGAQTWLLLQQVPDWRWLLDRHDSPWYPNHRLFRQRRRGEWGDVFSDVESQIRKILDCRP